VEKTEATEEFGRKQCEKRAGKEEARGVCPNQRSSQKKVEVPAPTTTEVADKKDGRPSAMARQTGESVQRTSPRSELFHQLYFEQN